MLTRLRNLVTVLIAEIEGTVDAAAEMTPADLEQAIVTAVDMPAELRNPQAAPRPVNALRRFNYRPPYQPTRVMYRKEFDVVVCLAVRAADAAAHENGKNGLSKNLLIAPAALPQERVHDERDTKIDFRNVIQSTNLVGDDSEKTDALFIDGGNRIILIEASLVVHDSAWASGDLYVRAQLDQVAPMQKTTHILGDSDEIVRRCQNAAAESTTPTSPRTAGTGTVCKANHMGQNVTGWCIECGLAPTAMTLYQPPLSDEQVVHYAEEILATDGTHSHVSRNDEMQETLEVSTRSNIARDLLARYGDNAVLVGDAADNILHVDRLAWTEEIANARQRILANLPLTDLTRAHITLAARGTPAHVTKTLRVVLAVQCIEFVNT